MRKKWPASPDATTRRCSGNHHSTVDFFSYSHIIPIPMSPPTVTEPRVCSRGIRCRHRGLPISINCFRKGNTLPNCYLFHKQCNDCRSTGGRIAEAYTLSRNIPPPSPPGVPKKKCRECKRQWSLPRFINNDGEQCPECEFCRGSNQGFALLIFSSNS